MLNITTSPSFDCLQIMDLSLQIDAKITGDEGFCWMAVKKAVKDKPACMVVNTVRDMAQDNFNAVADVLGMVLTNKIIEFK